jgi:hypothetical protein
LARYGNETFSMFSEHQYQPLHPCRMPRSCPP